MQPGLHNNGLIEDGGKVVGICFGADATSEHEGGHGPLKEMFGLPSNVSRGCFGLDARTVTKIPSHLFFFQFGYTTYLICSRGLNWLDEKRLTQSTLDRLIHARKDERLSTAWDEASFGVRLLDDRGEVLQGIYNRMRSNDAVIFQISGAWIGKGLHICVKSSVPEKIKTWFEEQDTSRLNLLEAFAATGIETRVKASGKRYFALSPRWFDEKSGIFKIWLNPWDQDMYHSNWFTVEELDAWIRDEGPVLKQQKVSA